MKLLVRIGRIDIDPLPEGDDPKTWKLIGKYTKKEFQQHMNLVPAPEHGLFVLGGVGGHNCLQFKNKNIHIKASMPEKTFFGSVCLKNKIYTFGGYDNYEKI